MKSVYVGQIHKIISKSEPGRLIDSEIEIAEMLLAKDKRIVELEKDKLVADKLAQTAVDEYNKFKAELSEIKESATAESIEAALRDDLRKRGLPSDGPISADDLYHIQVTSDSILKNNEEPTTPLKVV